MKSKFTQKRSNRKKDLTFLNRFFSLDANPRTAWHIDQNTRTPIFTYYPKNKKPAEESKAQGLEWDSWNKGTRIRIKDGVYFSIKELQAMKESVKSKAA